MAAEPPSDYDNSEFRIPNSAFDTATNIMDQIELFLKKWPRAAICMLLGALFGWIAWMFLPQNYIASVRLNLSIDFNRTGKLDDLEEARLIGIVEDSLHSDEIMEKVFAKSNADDFRGFYDTTQIYRTNEDWSLTVTGEDPEEIGRLARVWLDEAYELLYERRTHAIRAEALQNELDGLTRCIQNSGSAALAAVCDTDPEETLKKIDTYTEQIIGENELACGMSSALLIGEKNPQQLEIRSLSRPAGVCVLLGAFCGLLIAFAAAWFPEKGSSRK